MQLEQVRAERQPGVEVQIELLRKPKLVSERMQKQMYGFRRFTENEIFLPRKVFEKLRLS